MTAPVALSLFDRTGNITRPWLEAGFEAVIVDIQHPAGETREGRLTRIGADMRDWIPPREIVDRVCFVAAFPPCDHLAVSGARWFAGKGLGKLADSIRLFHVAARWADWFGVPYLIENPVSTISTYWRRPDHTFDPWQYSLLEPSDTYTKKTCLWTGGGFVMPAPRPLPDVQPDDRIHRMSPGPDRANARSATPTGFARAVFEANKPDRRAAA